MICDEMMKRITNFYILINILSIFFLYFLDRCHISWYHVSLLMEINSNARWSSEYHVRWKRRENKLIIWCFNNNRTTPQYSNKIVNIHDEMVGFTPNARLQRANKFVRFNEWFLFAHLMLSGWAHNANTNQYRQENKMRL